MAEDKDTIIVDLQSQVVRLQEELRSANQFLEEARETISITNGEVARLHLETVARGAQIEDLGAEPVSAATAQDIDAPPTT